MRIGASLVLIALGAILKFAVTKSVSGIDLGVVGVILMVIGVLGLLITLTLLSMRRRTDVIHHADGTTLLAANERLEPDDPRF
jgi:membrane-bound ClpP family serine protease